MAKKYYVTTPIYYPNAKPHLGTLYTTMLADVFARWHKLMGDNVFFLTGTDEHGQKIQDAALAIGKKPQDFVDAIVPAYKNLWGKYEIDYSSFIRTTDEKHIKGVTYILNKLIKQGDVYKSMYTGWYCVGCEEFIIINSDTPKDENGKHLCSIHKKHLEERAEESYFFRLSAYEDQLLEFYEKHPDFIAPKERFQEVISFVKSGLKDLSISRTNVSWGIPFPGDPKHTVYVWADALTNYITGIGYGQSEQPDEQFSTWWPADVHMMAKDIVRFHAVHWPAMLMAIGLPLPKKLLVHGYILLGEHKMSKSLGNIMDPEQLAAWYGVEPVRYYIMRQMAVTQDVNFDLKDVEERISADLANNLGNLLNRMLTLALNNNLDIVKPPVAPESSFIALKERCEETFRLYSDEMDKYCVHLALAQVWRFLSDVNAYFHAQKPWTLVAKNKELFSEVISSTCHSLYAAAVMLWPVMPQKMELLLATIGHSINMNENYEQVLRENKWDKIFKLSKTSEPLFIKPESHIEPVFVAGETKPSEPQTQEIAIEDFVKVNLHVGTVISCELVQGSEKLYKLQVDLGSIGKRQILSGVAQHFKPEELIGKQGVFVVNLKPRKMMGLESHGMMLFAEDSAGKLRPVSIDGSVLAGAKVR